MIRHVTRKHPTGTVAYTVGGKTYWRQPGLVVDHIGADGVPHFRKAGITHHGKPGVHARGRAVLPASAKRDAWKGRFTLNHG